MQEVWQIVHDEVGVFSIYKADNVYAVRDAFDYNPRADQYIMAWDRKRSRIKLRRNSIFYKEAVWKRPPLNFIMSSTTSKRNYAEVFM
ncbi:MAG: hypothetical protein U5P10_13520 [Spirochaetia bacterium]|nr:hypothetical protein [Spirochaetia bacterium]